MKGMCRPGRCCKLGLSCQCVPLAQGREGTAGHRSCLQREEQQWANSQLCAALPFQQCCITSTGLTPTSQHLSDFLSQQNVCFGKALLPLEAQGCWLSCRSSASARFVLHPNSCSSCSSCIPAVWLWFLLSSLSCGCSRSPSCLSQSSPTLWVQGWSEQGSV